MSALRKFVGSQVRVFRDMRGLTQIELADRIAVSKETIGKIERGAAAPSFETLDKLCKELRLSPRHLFPANVSAPDNPASTALEKLILQASKMNEAEVNWLLNLTKVASQRPDKGQ